MIDFAKTPMGKRYFEDTLPRLIESHNRLAKATEEQNALTATQIKQQERQLKLEHSRLMFEMKKANINENTES